MDNPFRHSYHIEHVSEEILAHSLRFPIARDKKVGFAIDPIYQQEVLVPHLHLLKVQIHQRMYFVMMEQQEQQTGWKEEVKVQKVFVAAILA